MGLFDFLKGSNNEGKEPSNSLESQKADLRKGLEDLPKRYWRERDYLDGEERFKHSVLSMKSTEFKKYYTKLINPYLKELGFKCTGFKALKEDEQFYYVIHYGSNQSGSEGNVGLYVHPKGLPRNGEFAWGSNSYKDQSDFIFKHNFRLPNGNEWFHIGSKEEEVIETCSYMLKSMEEQVTTYLLQFNNSFTSTILKINASNIGDNHDLLFNKFGLKSRGDHAAFLWMARFHLLYNSSSEANKLASLSINLIMKGANDLDQKPWQAGIDKAQKIIDGHLC
jgi:Domain of unknown function (DUF4304)